MKRRLAISVAMCGLAGALALSSTAGAATKTTKKKAALTVAGLGAPAPVETDVATLTAQVEKIFGAYPKVSGKTTRGVTAKTINFGFAGDITVGGQPALGGACEGMRARVNRANAAKELKRTINVVGCEDTAMDPNRWTTTLNDFVNSKKAFALSIWPVLPLPTNIMNESKVPYFGWGFNTSWCGVENPFAFGDTGAANCLAIENKTKDAQVVINKVIEYFVPKMLNKDPKAIKLAIIGNDTATAKVSVANEKRNAAAVGMEVVYAEAPIPSTPGATPDLSPYVTDIKNSGANAVFSLVSNSAPLIGALKQGGFTGEIYQSSLNEGFLQVPALGSVLDGTYGVLPGVGIVHSGGPGWDLVKAEADKAKVPANSGFIHGFFATDMFIHGAKLLERSGQAFTVENYTNLLNSGWRYPGLDGVFNAVDYPLGHFMGTACSSAGRYDLATKKIVPLVGLSCGGRQIVNG